MCKQEMEISRVAESYSLRDKGDRCGLFHAPAYASGIYSCVAQPRRSTDLSENFSEKLKLTSRREHSVQMASCM